MAFSSSKAKPKNVSSKKESPAPIPIGSVKTHRLLHLGSPSLLALLDAVAGFACTLLAFHASPSAGNINLVETHAQSRNTAEMFAALVFLGSYALGLNHYQNLLSRARIFVLNLALTFSALAATELVSAFIIYKQIGRYIVLIDGVLFFLVISAFRLIRYRNAKAAKHLVAIWSEQTLEKQLNSLLSVATFPIEVVHVFEAKTAKLAELQQAISDHRIHEIVTDRSDLEGECLLHALDSEIAVSTVAFFAERHFFKIPVEFISNDWFFRVDFKRHHPYYYPTKRLLDIILSACGLVLALPIIVVAAICIKANSRGPIFYSQLRVGYCQKPFRIWKLRSMRIDAEVLGAQWAKVRDPRVTFVGQLLRKTRVDEIPQFWNILKGEMAFVGPRPERPEFVESLSKRVPFYRQRHLMKPGLTGWAQICYPYGASENDAKEKLSYDLFYLKNSSLILDLQIIMQTIGAIAKGAR